MELHLNVSVRYAAQLSESIGDVLRHFESPAWVRLVLRQVLPQLKQISPTDPKELTKMVHDAEMHRPTAAEQETSCAICMGVDSTTPLSAVCTRATLELTCGHRFHSSCAQSWLKRRSTCPLCRFQLPKAYTGTFAVAAVQSTLQLSPEHDGLSPSELQTTPVSGQILQAAVTIALARISTDPPMATARPCQVNVVMVRAKRSSAASPHSRNDKRRRGERAPDTPGAIRSVFKRVRTT